MILTKSCSFYVLAISEANIINIAHSCDKKTERKLHVQNSLEVIIIVHNIMFINTNCFYGEGKHRQEIWLSKKVKSFEDKYVGEGIGQQLVLHSLGRPAPSKKVGKIIIV